jgi:hypothetical protein
MILNLPKKVSVLMACAAILHTSVPAMAADIGQSDWMQPGSNTSYAGGQAANTGMDSSAMDNSGMGDMGYQGGMSGQGALSEQSLDDNIVPDQPSAVPQAQMGQSEWMQSNAQTGTMQTSNNLNPAQLGQSEWMTSGNQKSFPATVAPTRASESMAAPELKGTVTRKQKYNPANDPSSPEVGGGGLGNLPGMLADVAQTVGIPLMMAGASGGFRPYGYYGGFRPYGFGRMYYGGRGGGNTAMFATGAGVYAAGRMMNAMRRHR